MQKQKKKMKPFRNNLLTFYHKKISKLVLRLEYKTKSKIKVEPKTEEE